MSTTGKRATAIRGLDHVQPGMPPRGGEAARAVHTGVLGRQEVSNPPALARHGGGCWTGRGPARVHRGADGIERVDAGGAGP